MAAKSGQRRGLDSSWVDEMESDVEALRDERSELRRRLREFDFEGEAIWEEQERRWRRVETKLQKLARRKGERVDPGLAANIENLLEAIEEDYVELNGLLD